MLIIKFVALVAFLFLPGYLAVSLLLGEKSGMGGGEKIFLAATCGCAAVALMAEALGLAGRFGLWPLLACWLVLCLALLIPARRRLAWLGRVRRREWVALALLALVGLVIFLPPGRVVFGWNDDGVYSDIAARMQREGDIHMQVEVVSEVAPERRDMVFAPRTDDRSKFESYLYKQYFITDSSAGKVVPQLFYLWPSFMAVFALFLGPDRMFFAITFAALLSLAGILMLARRMLGKRWPLAAITLIAASPLMIYFAKYTTSEMFTMAIFIAATLVLLVYQEETCRREKMGDAALAALFTTACFLIRIDFYILLPPLLLVFFWRRINYEWERSDTLFIVLFVLGFSLAMLMARLTSAPYFATIFYYSLEGPRKYFAIIGLAAAVAFVAFFFFPGLLKGIPGRLRRSSLLWKNLTWIALAGAFVFFYFIRPAIGDHSNIMYGIISANQGPTYDSQNLIRWGWYFSFPGLLLLFAGYGLAVTTEHRKSWSPMLATGLFATFFYLWSMRCTPLQIMVMRRIVPVIFPLAAILIIYTLKRVYSWPVPVGAAVPVRLLWPLRKVVAGLLLFYLVVFSIVAAWPVFRLSEGGNQAEVVAAAHQAAADGTLLMDFNVGDLFGPPLLSLEGQPNAWLTSNAITSSEDFRYLLEDLGFPERPVYLLWRPRLSGSDIRLAGGLGLEYVTGLSWREENLEISFEHRPDLRVTIEEPFEIYRIVPSD